MRWLYFFIAQILLITLVAGLAYLHKDRVMLVKKPPASLAKWYKPVNERQVWLHTMFNLRRELQAIDNYSASKEQENLEKWVAQFSEHYLKIAEMVPEWQKKLDTDALTSLQESARNREYEKVTTQLKQLEKSCDACHNDYRSITAALYRAPDFSGMTAGNNQPLTEQMEALSQQINQIKIATVDGKPEVALTALSDLRQGMQTLGSICESCHEKQHLQYPSETINQTADSLEESLKGGTLKEQGRHLGTLAVLACAQCHGTHRIAYDARVLFSDQRSLKQLMQH